ncbi:MAG: HDOD domain-containing protein [Burkholderiales bacterium]|nr:HDOD domain-containing protein [Burkholderiales bacterium]
MEPQHDLAAWVRYFSEVEIPVLAETANALEELRAKEDDVDAGMLAAVIDSDPLMTIKFMAHVAGKRRPGDDTETETVISSLVMTGVAPFFRNFGVQPTVEERLQDQPQALEGLRELLQRARNAAHFAMAFAVHRGDTDAAVIHQAAFLHDFAEMLMWCHAPTLALDIRSKQQANSTLRSASLQRFVYHIELDDLRQALMKLWHLPELLVRISDGKHADHPSVRNVVLAVRLARHTAHGWDNPALPDDINDIAILLNAAPRVVPAFLRKVALEPPTPATS